MNVASDLWHAARSHAARITRDMSGLKAEGREFHPNHELAALSVLGFSLSELFLQFGRGVRVQVVPVVGVPSACAPGDAAAQACGTYQICQRAPKRL
jgi:hypothetical protein